MCWATRDAAVEPVKRHSAYRVVAVGTPNSAWLVDWPLIHFQTSLSRASSVLFLRINIDLSAVRQPTAGPALAQPPDGSQESCVQTLASSQSSGVPGLQAPAPSQVSSPLQTVASGHGAPSG